jgi:hypothetical protein
MKYDLYFHNDFDGHASAAVFLNFLKTRGDDVSSINPVDHEIRGQWPGLKPGNSFAVFDFYFHPRAKYFFDHHQTTFIKEEWKKKFKESSFYYLKPKYLSCCGLVGAMLKRDHQYLPNKNIKELMKWLDIVDGAKYKSAKQAILMKEPALKINAYIDSAIKSGQKTDWIVEELASKSIALIAKNPKIISFYEKTVNENKKSMIFYKKSLQIFMNTSFIDLSKTRVARLRTAPYFLQPKLLYNITIKNKDGGYRISIGSNPWINTRSKVDLGLILRRFCGGGGHYGAAGGFVKSKKEAQAVIDSVIFALTKKKYDGFRL